MRAFERLFVFDLDDTLYLERDYVMSGFAAVGRWVARHHGIKGFPGIAAELFESGHRGDVFDRALARLDHPATHGLIADLVDCYRQHRPRIQLAPDAAQWLAAMPQGGPAALITDGPTASQSRKISALGLDRAGLAPIVMTDRWGIGFSKPHPRSFETVQVHYGAPAEACVYVADNASKDFLAPRRLGWLCVQICRSGGLHQLPPPSPDHAPHLVIDSLAALADQRIPA